MTHVETEPLLTPAGVGLHVLTWLREVMQAPDVLRQRVTALRVVDPDGRPDEDDIDRLGRYADRLTPSSLVRHWWQLLWQTQGDPEVMLEAGVIADASTFPLSSGCEWGYLADLDTMVFEVYRGGQKRPHQRGRFANRPGPPGHHPAALAAAWPLDRLPRDLAFLNALATVP
ncbi:MAG TPA: hypothetical protein VFV66_24090 [Nonomuraea sp.]|nr:hypothetical protein [Nonomuraea sp.]